MDESDIIMNSHEEEKYHREQNLLLMLKPILDKENKAEKKIEVPKTDPESIR